MLRAGVEFLHPTNPCLLVCSPRCKIIVAEPLHPSKQPDSCLRSMMLKSPFLFSSSANVNVPHFDFHSMIYIFQDRWIYSRPVGSVTRVAWWEPYHLHDLYGMVPVFGKYQGGCFLYNQQQGCSVAAVQLLRLLLLLLLLPLMWNKPPTLRTYRSPVRVDPVLAVIDMLFEEPCHVQILPHNKRVRESHLTRKTLALSVQTI